MLRVVFMVLIMGVICNGRVKRDMRVPEEEVRGAIKYVCNFLGDYGEGHMAIIEDDDPPVCFPVPASFLNGDVQTAYKIVRDDLLRCRVSPRATYQTLYDYRQLLQSIGYDHPAYDDSFCVPLRDIPKILIHFNCNN